ncbi:hypothetical protein GCM10025858_04280 [Alicyclobacillus sacchari]|nr:hypothetical protein GCM10025858_04280 [Alicyclobacillus sacchari]
MHIARDHLLPRQRERHALKGDKMRLGDDVLMELIRHYTREAAFVSSIARLPPFVARSRA